MPHLIKKIFSLRVIIFLTTYKTIPWEEIFNTYFFNNYLIVLKEKESESLVKFSSKISNEIYCLSLYSFQQNFLLIITNFLYVNKYSNIKVSFIGKSSYICATFKTGLIFQELNEVILPP